MYNWAVEIRGDGNLDTEIRRRITAGANAWRKVDGVMGGRRLSRKLKGKVLTSSVTRAYYVWLRNDGTKRETTAEGGDLRKQPDNKNRGSEEIRNWQKSRCPKSGGKNEAKKTANAMGGLR